MAAKSCRKIEVLMTTDAILNFIAENKEPINATEIAKGTNLTTDSVFRQLGTMEELGWVRKIGDGYTPGMRLAVIWARVKANTEGQINKLKQDLDTLG
ncbi:MAG: helix-turn-helix domain-containing protein [Smithella sp.]|jgi:DNA-binding IclR family transcriptional regulator